MKLSAAELDRVVRLDADGDGRLTQDDLDRLGPKLVAKSLDLMSVIQGGARCPLTPVDAQLDGADGLVLTGVWKCPQTIDRAQVRVGFIEALPMGHTHFAKVERPGEIPQQLVLHAGNDSFELLGNPSVWDTAVAFLAEGVKHIFGGYDHIAFLLGLLLLGGTFKGLVKIVTSFSVAHSITLALAVLDVVAPPPRVVEPLIAASIVFVAAENLWAMRRPGVEAAAMRHRWMLTFGFGLVHGFGFASGLRELHLPKGNLAASLVTFNLGVEVGQLAIVAAAFPLLAFLRRRRGFVPVGVRVLSGAIGGVGLYWLVERVLLAPT